jgi:hypothetical protein
LTGEEEESNVLQANVKLYLFDREKRNAPQKPFLFLNKSISIRFESISTGSELCRTRQLLKDCSNKVMERFFITSVPDQWHFGRDSDPDCKYIYIILQRQKSHKEVIMQ